MAIHVIAIAEQSYRAWFQSQHFDQNRINADVAIEPADRRS